MKYIMQNINSNNAVIHDTGGYPGAFWVGSLVASIPESREAQWTVLAQGVTDWCTEMLWNTINEELQDFMCDNDIDDDDVDMVLDNEIHDRMEEVYDCITRIKLYLLTKEVQ